MDLFSSGRLGLGLGHGLEDSALGLGSFLADLDQDLFISTDSDSNKGLKANGLRLGLLTGL